VNFVNPFFIEHVQNFFSAERDVPEYRGKRASDNQPESKLCQRPLSSNYYAATDGAWKRIADRGVVTRFDNSTENALRRVAEFLDVGQKQCSCASRRKQSFVCQICERDAARSSAQKERCAVAALVIG
jgi:hypothetical protein